MANQTVTISAEWFDELRRKEKEFNTINGVRANSDSYDAIRKERDELKAKLDGAEVDRETYKDRAEAAERCIEECGRNVESTENVLTSFTKIGETIRTWRKQKKAK